jgi:succinate dehydrogenase hydrophobic anchor subunit
MWLFTRLSGLAMMLFGAVSMGLAFAMGGRLYLDMPTMLRWVFFPNPNHVVNSEIPDVTVGWSNAFWQIYATLLFFTAASHGFNGLRMVLEDYIERPLLVYALRGLLLMSWLASMIFAIYVILAS